MNYSDTDKMKSTLFPSVPLVYQIHMRNLIIAKIKRREKGFHLSHKTQTASGPTPHTRLYNLKATAPQATP
jgi:hypothetical protein